MVKKICKTVFIIIMVGGTLFLIYTYKQAVPLKYFYTFIIFIGMLALGEVILHKIVKEKVTDNPNLLKIIDLLCAIVFGILLYLYFIYIYPGK